MVKRFMIIALIIFAILLVGCSSTENIGNVSEASKNDVGLSTDESNSSSEDLSPDGSSSLKEDLPKDDYLSGELSYIVLRTDLDINREYDIRDFETFQSYSPKEHMSFEINGQTYEGTFKEVSYLPNNYYPTYEYCDNEKNTFGVDINGELIYLSFYGLSDDGEKISQEQSEIIAEEFAKKYFDTEEYVRTVSNRFGRYRIDYVKYIDGIKTDDSATIRVTENGQIKGFVARMLGKIPSNIDTKKIDFNKAELSVYERLDEIYKEAKEKFTKIEYNQFDIYITMLKDGNIGLVADVNVDCIMGTSLRAERLRFVITLK